MQMPLPFEETSDQVADFSAGAVYTRPWVVELLLDLAGYVAGADLSAAVAVEPATGEGAFLVAMVRRLVGSCRRQGHAVEGCAQSLIAYEINATSAQVARDAVDAALRSSGVSAEDARRLATTWVRTGDYLAELPRLPGADFVVGNPPYIRLEDVPDDRLSAYRRDYRTMIGRADLYVAFFEAGLRQLVPGGVCAYICADRWMLNQYGAELRRFVTRGYSVQTVIEMHNADAFDSTVSAYPAISVIRREEQGPVVVASIEGSLQGVRPDRLLAALRPDGDPAARPTPPPALKSTVVDRWFSGPEPWPSCSPRHLAVLRRLEEDFPMLEADGRARVGIGVATGCDEVFITQDPNLVEPSRLLPLALAADTLSGINRWSGHYLVDPWDGAGLVRLSRFPRLAAHLEGHRERLSRRHTAKKNPQAWYRTIDRVAHPLTSTPKLLIPDIKNVFNPVLDGGKVYPHHNLYFICSDRWDLELLGGILLSTIGQLFIEAYGVRMRGGYLRFQAQYLRRIRVPEPGAIKADQAASLIRAFRERDRALASTVAQEIYGVDPAELA